MIGVLTLLMGLSAQAHVKTASLKVDELLTVRTAIGIATIVQTEGPIQSAIIGDQSGFKVEYLDRAVTIKPLRFGAKTNLYLVTEKRRYNLTLAPSTQDQADYVVYIREKAVQPNIRWQNYSRESKSLDLILKVTRVGSTGGTILIDALVSSKNGNRINPEQVWLLQGSTSRVINSLFLSDRKVSRDKPIRIALSVLKADIDIKLPLKLTLKTEKSITLDLPESLWK